MENNSNTNNLFCWNSYIGSMDVITVYREGVRIEKSGDANPEAFMELFLSQFNADVIGLVDNGDNGKVRFASDNLYRIIRVELGLPLVSRVLESLSHFRSKDSSEVDSLIEIGRASCRERV